MSQPAAVYTVYVYNGKRPISRAFFASPAVLAGKEKSAELIDIFNQRLPGPRAQLCAGIFKQSTGARNRVGIGLSYGPARQHSLAELVLVIDSGAP